MALSLGGSAGFCVITSLRVLWAWWLHGVASEDSAALSQAELQAIDADWASPESQVPEMQCGLVVTFSTALPTIDALVRASECDGVQRIAISLPQGAGTARLGALVDAFMIPRPWWRPAEESYEWQAQGDAPLVWGGLAGGDSGASLGPGTVLQRLNPGFESYMQHMAKAQFPSDDCTNHDMCVYNSPGRYWSSLMSAIGMSEQCTRQQISVPWRVYMSQDDGKQRAVAYQFTIPVHDVIQGRMVGRCWCPATGARELATGGAATFWRTPTAVAHRRRSSTIRAGSAAAGSKRSSHS
jgi:hypothetical protein